MATSEAINSDPNRVAKRNALILSAAQALNGHLQVQLPHALNAPLARVLGDPNPQGGVLAGGGPNWVARLISAPPGSPISALR